MKNYKLVINVLLIAISVLSIISFSLLIPSYNNYLETYNHFKDLDIPNVVEELKVVYTYMLQTLFSIIFSALCAVASAITLFLLNFKVWKKDEEK